MRLGRTPNANSLSPEGHYSLQEADLPEKCSRPHLQLFCFFLSLLFTGLAQSAPQLTSDLTVSSEGYFVLSWEAPVSDNGLRLQQSNNPDFSRDIEEWSVSGASQFTQSGLTNGAYYYRLVDNNGTSNTVQVQVQHHSLTRATLFFSLGAVLFSILILTLVFGRRSLQGGAGQ